MGKFVAAFTAILVLLGAGSVPAYAQASDTELSFWERVRDREAPVEFKAFLKAYPDARLAPLAQLRTKELKGPDASAVAQAEPRGFEASASSTSDLEDLGDLLDLDTLDDAADVDIAETLKTRLVGKVYEGDELDDQLVIEGWEDLGGGLMIEPIWFHYFRRKDDAYLVLANMALPRRHPDAKNLSFRITDVLVVPPLEEGQEVAFYCRVKGSKRKRAIVAVIQPDYEKQEEWWKDLLRAWTISLDSGQLAIIDTAGVECVNEGWGL
jgi:hypothetical protein